LRKRLGHLYPMNFPSAIGGTTKEFAPATTQFEHLVWPPEDRLCKRS
jgi:hypothetical protein